MKVSTLGQQNTNSQFAAALNDVVFQDLGKIQMEKTFSLSVVRDYGCVPMGWAVFEGG
jgi:hypothetical protein